MTGTFPLVHPDNRLFEIFGQTPQKVIAEERRLFYVSITRAAKKLYFLTEKQNESPFLNELGMIDQWKPNWNNKITPVPMISEESEIEIPF